MNILNKIFKRKVSYQRNVWSKIENINISIEEIVNKILDGAYKDEISILRNYLRDNNTELYNMHKIRLPAVTFCGLFKDIRRKENLVKYNDLIVIDIDKLTEIELNKMRSILMNDNFVLAFWASPSEHGIKGLVPVQYINEEFKENIDLIDYYHKYAFERIKFYFNSKYNIQIDESGSDTTRLCFLSYDPNLVVKESAVEFKVDNSTLELGNIYNKKQKIIASPRTKTSKNQLFNPNGKNSSRDRNTIQSIIKYLTKRGLSITDNYTNWYRVGLGIANTFTYELGEKYFLRLCRLDGMKHDEEGSKNLLLYCYKNTRNEIKLSTIIYLAKQKGYKNDGDST